MRTIPSKTAFTALMGETRGAIEASQHIISLINENRSNEIAPFIQTLQQRAKTVAAVKEILLGGR